MQMKRIKMELKEKQNTDRLIKTFYDVYTHLGYGFLEKIYQNSMFIELQDRGFMIESQKQLKVYYKDIGLENITLI